MAQDISTVMRPRVLSNSAAEFVETRAQRALGAELASDQGPGPQYVSELVKFVRREDITQADYYAESQKKVAALKTRLVGFSKKMHALDNGYKIAHKAPEQYDMNDVLEIVRRIEDKHRTLDKVMSCSGIIRRCFRAVGENSGAIEGLLSFAPDDIYGSIISGGFTLILGALERADKIRSDIYGAVADVPYKIMELKDLLGVHIRSAELQRRADSVFVAIFDVLFAIVEELSKNLAKKGLSLIIKGSRYGTEIDELITTLEGSLNSFRIQAKICDSQRLGKMDTRVARAALAAENAEGMASALGQHRDSTVSDRPQNEEEAKKHIAQIQKALGESGDQAVRIIDSTISLIANTLSQSPVQFFLELLQNADDNAYADSVDPKLVIKFTEDTLQFDTNELGFRRQDVQSICSMGQSTKKEPKKQKGKAASRIGEKGIGFKAVFRVAEQVFIHSGHYSFQFDSRRELGCIKPEWAVFPGKVRPGWTSIHLKLKPGLDREQLVEEMGKFDATLLLFLKKIRAIQVQIQPPHKWLPGRSSNRTMQRLDDASGLGGLAILSLTPSTFPGYAINHYTVRGMPPALERPSRAESEIVLAFPKAPQQQKEAAGFPGEHRVYTFLPIRSYGFKFVIQADFLLTAGREDIMLDSDWNRALREAIPPAVVDSIPKLRAVPELRYQWPRFFPVRHDTDDFFSDLSITIRDQVADKEWVERESLTPGLLGRPSDLRLVPKEYALANDEETGCLLRPIIPADLSLFAYPSSMYPTESRDGLACLGMKILSAAEFLEDLSNLVHKHTSQFQSIPRPWHSRLAEILRPLVNDHQKLIFSLPLILTHQNNWVALQDGPFFFPTESGCLEMPWGLGSIVHPDVAKDTAHKALLDKYEIKPAKDKEAVCRAVTDAHAHNTMGFDDPAKNADQDSGYGSASRAPTLVTSSQQSVPGVADLIDPRPRLSDLGCEDVRSIVSDNDDITSQATDETTAAALTGKTLIRTFLSDEPRFRALCEKATSAMGDERFVQNMRRLLKSFHKNLLEEASTDGEKAVAKLLRSRPGRLRISLQLVVFLRQDQEGWDGGRVEVRVAPQEQRAVESWLGAVAKNPECHWDRDPTPVTAGEPNDSEPSSEDEIDVEDEEFPHISELRRFLQRAESYERLLKDFELMFLPAWLARVLRSVSKENITLSTQQDISVANSLKSWVEDHTQVRWNWWPLERRKRPLRDGQFRIFWKCSCGALWWKEISAEQAGSVRQILNLSMGRPDLSTKCVHTRARNLSEILSLMTSNVVRSHATGAMSSAAQRYTPPNSDGSSPPANEVTSGSGPSQGTGDTGRTISLRTLVRWLLGLFRAAESPPESTTDKRWWILVAVQAAWPSSAVAPISQFGLNDKNNDSDFFRKLKQCYEGQRGWWRLWFLIWQLDYCEMTRFRQIAPTLLARERSDLPRKDEYCYDPRPDHQDATNPPIEDDVFQACYYSCPPSCIWSAFHHCIPDQTGTENLVRIPKRTKRFGEDQKQPVWGLEPVFAVSFFRVALYHFLILVGPFAYFGVYDATNPGDLQNATVPASIVLSFLSVFWALAGLSPVRGKRDQAG
ncbi:hypothetical protein RB595_003849 [Gaeumannomyces hyphopodioides]